MAQKEDDVNIKALEAEVRHLEEKHEKLFAAKQEFEQVCARNSFL